MIASFKAHMEILPPAQKELWPRLKPASSLGMVLYGGTAIALRLGHRRSIDFDFFSDLPLDKRTLKSAFPFLEQATTLQEQPDTLTVLINEGKNRKEHVKVSFFGNVTMGRVGNPETTEDGVLQVASLDDLMATKIKVVLQRIEAKDYQDIAAMVRHDVSLATGLAAARKMYGNDFQPSEALKALVYFEGGDLQSMSEQDRKTLIQNVRDISDLPPVEIASHSLGLETQKV